VLVTNDEGQRQRARAWYQGEGLLLQFEPSSRARMQPLANGESLATFEGTETNPIRLRLRFDYGEDGRAVRFRAGEASGGTTPHAFTRVESPRTPVPSSPSS
jgi:hypothetical protein